MRSFTPEYRPAASHCHTSTIAPLRGAHPPFAICCTLKLSASGSPELLAPVLGSTRISARSSCLSRKYGPTVSSGFATQRGNAFAAAVAGFAGAPLATGAAAVAPLGERWDAGLHPTTAAALVAASSRS